MPSWTVPNFFRKKVSVNGQFFLRLFYTTPGQFQPAPFFPIFYGVFPLEVFQSGCSLSE